MKKLVSIILLLLGAYIVKAQIIAIGAKGGVFVYKWEIDEIEERYSPTEPNAGVLVGIGLNEFLELHTFLGYSERSLKVNESFNGPATGNPLLWRHSQNIDLSLGIKSNIIFDAQAPFPLFIEFGVVGSYSLKEERQEGFLAHTPSDIVEIYQDNTTNSPGNPALEIGGYGQLSYRFGLGDGLFTEFGATYYHGFTSIKDTNSSEFTLNHHRGFGATMAVLFVLE